MDEHIPDPVRVADDEVGGVGQKGDVPVVRADGGDPAGAVAFPSAHGGDPCRRAELPVADVDVVVRA